MKHTAFYGDGEKVFALTFEMILELERKTGHGIGALFNRVRSYEFTFSDILEIVRLGLIGGGSTPQEAAALVAAYGVNRPIGESLKIAVDLLTVVFFGEDAAPDQTPGTNETEAAALDAALEQVAA